MNTRATILGLCLLALSTTPAMSATHVLTFDAQAAGPVNGSFTEGSFTLSEGESGYSPGLTIANRTGSNAVENIAPGFTNLVIRATSGGLFTLTQLDLASFDVGASMGTYVAGFNQGVSVWGWVPQGGVDSFTTSVNSTHGQTPIDELRIVLGGGASYSREAESVDNIVLELAVEETPQDKINDLTSYVQSLGLQQGMSTSLTAKLQDALTALAGGDTVTAATALQDFVNQVAAQTGKKIDPTTAAKLTADATAILQSITG